MIFCNQCGNQLEPGGTCAECALSLPSIANTAASNHIAGVPQSQSYSEPGHSKTLVVGFVVIAVLGVAVLIYLSTRTSSTTANDMAAANSAAALKKAIESRRLITLTGDDAYTYFDQLKKIDPQNAALRDVKAQVLQDLLKIGEEVVQRKVNHSGEVSEQDWRLFIRAYEWARQLQPEERRVDARYKYALGKLAEMQGYRSEAWQNLSAATQIDPAWGVPQNDLGYWTTQNNSSNKQKWADAIPYYEKAISLMPNWEIPYNNLGTAYFYLGNFEQAEIHYRHAIERNSNWARPHKWLGDIYLNRNDFPSAMMEYQTANNLYNPATDSLDISYIQRKIAQLRARGY